MINHYQKLLDKAQSLYMRNKCLDLEREIKRLQRIITLIKN